MNSQMNQEVEDIRSRFENSKSNHGDYGVPGMKWGEHKAGEENQTTSSETQTIGKLKRDEPYVLSGSSSTPFKLPNGTACSDDDIVKAVSYMYGKKPEQVKNELKNGEYSNGEIQKSVNYHETIGLPHEQRMKYFNELNEKSLKMFE